MMHFAMALGLFLGAESSQPMNEHTERSTRIRTTFNEVRVDTLYLLDDLYAEDLVFQDPLGTMNGLQEFKIYMESMYQYVQDIQWEYTDEVIQGDTHVLYWTMTLQTKGLNKGEPFSVDGTSRMQFGDGDKIVFHRDYFDMGDYVYERVPVVRWFVKFVKRRLHKAVEEARERVVKEVDGAEATAE